MEIKKGKEITFKCISKDPLIFQLAEDAKAGDYIDLSRLQNINFSAFNEYFANEAQKEKEKYLARFKEQEEK